MSMSMSDTRRARGAMTDTIDAGGNLSRDERVNIVWALSRYVYDQGRHDESTATRYAVRTMNRAAFNLLRVQFKFTANELLNECIRLIDPMIGLKRKLEYLALRADEDREPRKFVVCALAARSITGECELPRDMWYANRLTVGELRLLFEITRRTPTKFKQKFQRKI